MINKLRQNYSLSLWIVRLAFVATFVLANWRQSAMILTMMMGMNNIVIALLSCLLSAVIALVIYPFIINLLLNLFSIYCVPRAEYVLLALIYTSLAQLIAGLLGCIQFFTPVVATWGAVLFRFIGATVAMILFYKKTAELYFNHQTRVHYFRNVAIVYFVAMILGVFA